MSLTIYPANGGGGTPGGSNTQVQYNNAGAFGGITGATTNGTALTLVAPVLGTPASGTLTNCTGLPISTGVSGLGTNVGTFLGTPSSANLAAAVTDETGSGALVFANTPSLVTPNLGTPTSGTLTNCTGLPVATGISGLGTGVATALAVNVGSAGAPVVFNGALGTPSSGTLTNATGLPIATGVSGLGANVATFLATPSSANLASAVTGETGTGALVFGSNPVLTSTSANQLRVAYDGSNYWNINVGSNGVTTFTLAGTGPYFEIDAPASFEATAAFTNAGGGTSWFPFSDNDIYVSSDNIIFRNNSNAEIGRLSASGLLIISPTRGIGYGTGAGGAQTQATDKSTGVTSNTVTTAITMNSATLNADTAVSFTFTNSTIAATDQVVVTHQSAGTSGAYVLNAFPGAGSAVITVRNITASNLSEAIVLRVSVYKAVSA